MRKNEVNHIVSIYDQNIGNDIGLDPATFVIAALSEDQLVESKRFMKNQDEESFNELMKISNKEIYLTPEDLPVDMTLEEMLTQPNKSLIDWFDHQVEITVASTKRDLLRSDYAKLREVTEMQYALTKRFVGKTAISGFITGTLFGMGLDYELQESANTALINLGANQHIPIYSHRPIDIVVDLVGSIGGAMAGWLIATKLSPRIAKRKAQKLIDKNSI